MRGINEVSQSSCNRSNLSHHNFSNTGNKISFAFCFVKMYQEAISRCDYTSIVFDHFSIRSTNSDKTVHKICCIFCNLDKQLWLLACCICCGRICWARRKFENLILSPHHGHGYHNPTINHLQISTSIYQHRLNRLKLVIKSALVGLIHDKTMNSPSIAYDNGESTTLMSTDVDGLVGIAEMFHETWAQFVEVVIGILLLAREVGWVWPLPLFLIFREPTYTYEILPCIDACSLFSCQPLCCE